MMNPLSLIKKYGDQVDIHILSQYKQPDRYLYVNDNDKDLIPIRLDLPEPPEPHHIANFGKPAKDQFFEPPKVPRRLKELQRKHETIDEIWEQLQKHQDIYAEEIKFIRKAWYHRLNGYWFYNNGKPTYLDGWHYFYCAWWHIDVGLPKYRDRDRKFFLFARMCYNERKTFKILDDKGHAVLNEQTGYYDFVDTGGRVFYGFNYPKHRREGATYKAECINYEIISRTIGAWGGIQSMNETQGRKCFLKHLVAPWKKLPFFFRPNYEGSTSPKTELSFSPPAKRLSSKGSLATSEIGLESMINFDNADPGAYDGDKLYFHHDDEVGKLKKGLSCWDRHLVVKECLVMGSDIIGFTIKTSTVGEMERGGGKMFKHQCQMSNYFERTPNGQTRSGLATLFIPACEGLQGFIDQYGNSVIDTPTKEQAAYIGRKIGAREYLLNRRKGYIDAGDYEGLSEEIRLYPLTFTECFRTAAKSSGFNMQKLETYIDELRFRPHSDMPVEGDFQWVNNERDTRVIFVAKKGGKFRVSHQLNDNESNRKYWDDITNSWRPGNTSWGVAGADPFKFNKTEGNRKSNGGGAVVRKGKIKDGDFSMKRKFVCTYSNRTYDKYDYAEDMLMMCIYYGVSMFPEINVDLIWDYFEQRGYAGFLLYRVDPKTFQQQKTPGANTNDKIKQDIFGEFMNFIEFEADEENHIELLEECRDIAGPEEMTDYDLFSAGGYALLGTADIYTELEEIESEQVTMDKFFRKRVYNK
jgi:hypothetical protein